MEEKVRNRQREIARTGKAYIPKINFIANKLD